MTQTVHDAAEPALHLRLTPDDDGEAVGGAGLQGECDALADLFMAGTGAVPLVDPTPAPVASSRLGPVAHRPSPRPEPPPASCTSAPAPIEAMVLGHLPVLASAWAPQYARVLAATTAGPVGLVRFRSGTVTVEVHGTPPREEAAGEPTVDAAIARAAASASRWLISVDATGEPALADMLRAGRVQTLTLLTGADEAASVACYRTMKSLLGGAGSEPEIADVRIAVMGAAEARARETGDRLARAAEAFLGFTPMVLPCAARIEPAPSVVLFRGQSEATLADALEIIGRTRPPAAPAPTASAPVLPGEVVVPAAPGTATRPPASAQTKTGPGAAGGALASLVPDLRPLGVVCPYAREVEFACRADTGRLQVLAWDSSDGAPPVAALAAASAWAVLNAELIGAACPGVSLGEAPVQRVFTRDARRVRGLLDSPVRVHLVLGGEGPTGAVCGELN